MLNIHPQTRLEWGASDKKFAVLITKIPTMEKEDFESLKRAMSHLTDMIRLNHKAVLCIDDLVTYTRIPKSTIYKYTQANEIPYSKVGKKLFFDREKIDQWLLKDRYAEHSL